MNEARKCMRWGLSRRFAACCALLWCAAAAVAALAATLLDAEEAAAPSEAGDSSIFPEADPGSDSRYATVR
ncbi:MAG: hypothetical protein ACHP7E_04670 [Burkholderiales bacterium]